MKKKNSIFVLLILISFSVNAQDAKNNEGKVLSDEAADITNVHAPHAVFSTKGMSPNTAFLLADMMKRANDPNAITEQQLINKYALKKLSGKLYANSFIIGETPTFNIADLKTYGVLPGIKSGKVFTGLVPIDQIMQVVHDPSVKYLDIGQIGFPQLDSARRQTHVDEVHQGLTPLTMPYKGDGVVVGVIDNGVDFTHPNFYDSTGTNNYRIKRVWLHRDNTGPHPTGFNYGTELTTQSAILNAKTDNTEDVHGSHTTGIAAGAGGYPGSPYVGVAPHSDIVIVGTDFNSTNIFDGIKYIQAYAASVNKPCVINISIGGQSGPHDGTSAFDQACDSTVGPGKLIVGAAGNDGENPIYIGHSFSGAIDTVVKTFLTFGGGNWGGASTTGTGVFNIWGNPNENFYVQLRIFNLNTHQSEAGTTLIPANANNSNIVDSIVGTNNIAVHYLLFSGISPLNNKPTITLGVDNLQPDANRVVELLVYGHNTSINLWGIKYSNFGYVRFNNFGYSIPVYNGTSDHTVAEIGGTGNSMISVGAYTSKNNWTALYDNSIQTGPNPTSIGNIALFSSIGPTIDGRTKPDITAPGNVIVSSINSYDTSYLTNLSNVLSVADKVTIGNHDWYYATDQGTSMAAPMVTGILALWLQQNPNLTRAQAITMMKNSAITDNYTGTIPANGSNTWGWGKINAFQGLVSVTSVDNVNAVTNTKVYPNPATNEVNIAFDKMQTATRIEMYDMSGKLVYQKQIVQISSGQIESINTNQLASGTYLLKINNGKDVNSYKIIKQ